MNKLLGAIIGAGGLGALLFFATRAYARQPAQTTPTPKPKQPYPIKVCNDGDVRCISNDLYKCVNNHWTIVAVNSNYCRQEREKHPTTCMEGKYKCGGTDLYKCVNGKWILMVRNSSLCYSAKQTNYLFYFQYGDRMIEDWCEITNNVPSNLVKISKGTMQFYNPIRPNVKLDVYVDKSADKCFFYAHSNQFYPHTWWKSTRIHSELCGW